MPILSLLRKGKEGKGMDQLPVQHQLSETFSGGETPLPVRLQRLITSLCWRRALLLLDPGGGSTGSLSGPALVLQLRLFFSLGYSLQWILPFFLCGTGNNSIQSKMETENQKPFWVKC